MQPTNCSNSEIVDGLVSDQEGVICSVHFESPMPRSDIDYMPDEASVAFEALEHAAESRVWTDSYSGSASMTGTTGDVGSLSDLEWEDYDPHQPDTLTTRSSVALRTSQSCNAHAALRMLSAVLRRERIRGPLHPDTLTTRGHIAYWIGRAGDAEEARRKFSELCSDRERVQSRDDPDTLSTRGNIAYWTGRSGRRP